MFKVPGLIGQPIHTSVAVSSEGEGDLHDSSGLASPHSIAPAYGNFQEYVQAIAAKEEEQNVRNEKTNSLIKELQERIHELKQKCAKKQTISDCSNAEKEIRKKMDEKFKDTQDR